ncbi:MAG: ATP-binding cassette domain-containing protein [Spirochaetales bacterium]|nr:ATP-binding cassette domain-containing protein [Spirochaetales bacterium]
MIRIVNLTKFYNTTCALDHINLEIREGEILGLLGPNGAGKTTALRILTCYMQPTEGMVYVKDFNIFDHPLEIKKMIGYLPESAPIYKHMLVYEYLRYVADVREIEKSKEDKRIQELADLCGLNEVMHKTVEELSKGYKQRVGLAHAMMGNPEILILDEPTSGLDPNQRIEVRDIIKGIGKKKTVILSTHILPEVESTCERVVIINEGKIIADDYLQKLKESSGNRFTINLTVKGGQFDAVKSALSRIEGISKINKVQDSDSTVSLVLDCMTDKDVRPLIFSEIKQNNWEIIELYQEKATLETIFRKLTREV